MLLKEFGKEAKAYRGNKSIFGQIIVEENCGTIQKFYTIFSMLNMYWVIEFISNRIEIEK